MDNTLETLDVIGYELQEGLKIIKRKYTSTIKIIETAGYSKHKSSNLDEQRILKVSKSNDDCIEVIIGFF